MKIKLKKEIVTLGVNNISPNKLVGNYVKPRNWNELISDNSVLLIDTRNDYEVSIGSLKMLLIQILKISENFLSGYQKIY